MSVTDVPETPADTRTPDEFRDRWKLDENVDVRHKFGPVYTVDGYPLIERPTGGREGEPRIVGLVPIGSGPARNAPKGDDDTGLLETLNNALGPSVWNDHDDGGKFHVAAYTTYRITRAVVGFATVIGLFILYRQITFAASDYNKVGNEVYAERVSLGLFLLIGLVAVLSLIQIGVRFLEYPVATTTRYPVLTGFQHSFARALILYGVPLGFLATGWMI